VHITILLKLINIYTFIAFVVVVVANRGLNSKFRVFLLILMPTSCFWVFSFVFFFFNINMNWKKEYQKLITKTEIWNFLNFVFVCVCKRVCLWRYQIKKKRKKRFCCCRFCCTSILIDLDNAGCVSSTSSFYSFFSLSFSE